MAVVQNMGTLATVNTTDTRLATWGGNSRGAVQLIGGGSMSYEQIYRRQLWVNVAANKLMRGIGRLPFKPYRHTGEDRERIRPGDAVGGKLAERIQRPYPRASTFQLWEATVGGVAIHGKARAAILCPEPGAPPDAIVPLDWKQITPRYLDGQLALYEIRPNPNRPDVFYLRPDEVFECGFWKGVSPLEPLAVTLGLEDAAQRYQTASFRNGARPSGLITTAVELKPHQIERLERQVQGKHTGADNAFRVAILDQVDAKWQQMSHTAVETSLIDARRLNREEVAAAFDIPPPIIGILDRATFSNVSEQHKMLYVDTLGPWLVMLESAFRRQIIDAWPDYAGTFAEFDLGEVLRGDPKERAEAYQKWLQGIYTVNDLRKMENLPRIDHPLADTVFMPMNLAPVGGADAADGGAAGKVKLAMDVGTAVQRLGLGVNYEVLTAEEARTILDIAGLVANHGDGTAAGAQAAALGTMGALQALVAGAGADTDKG